MDTCGRVLGGGVKARFRTRLEPVLTYATSLGSTEKLSRIQTLLLNSHGISINKLQSTLQSLADSARKIAH
jgi:hypothetical protein